MTSAADIGFILYDLIPSRYFFCHHECPSQQRPDNIKRFSVTNEPRTALFITERRVFPTRRVRRAAHSRHARANKVCGQGVPSEARGLALLEEYEKVHKIIPRNILYC